MRKYTKEYLENAYYHCQHYLVCKRLHWIEKVFWAIWVTLALVGAIFVVYQSVENFYSAKASISVKTNYLDLVSPFPAIFFCEKKDLPGKVEKMLKGLNFSAKSELANIGNFARHVTFIQPSSSNPLLNDCEDENNEFCVFTMIYYNNMSVFEKYLRSTCEEIFTSCLHNGKEFDCCEHFLPVDTFEGTCYAINSFNGIMQHKLNYDIRNIRLDKIFPFMLKHDPGNDLANISVEVAHTALSFWYLGNTNIPSKMYQKDNYFDPENVENLKKIPAVDIYLRSEEVAWDHSVYFLKEKLRACRFWDEHHSLKGIRIYSNSACEIECLREAQMRYCGCVLHILPNQKGLKYQHCNISGIRCTMSGRSKEKISDFLTYKCDCITNCGFIYVYIVGYVPHEDVRLSKNHEKTTLKQKEGNLHDHSKVFPFVLKHDPGNDLVNISVEVAHPALSFWYLGNTNIPSKMYQKDNYFDPENVENLKKFPAVDIYLRSEEVSSDHSVYFLKEKLRACRFWYEHHSLKGIRIYSNSACEIECLREAQMRFCGCVLHILPNQKGLKYKHCNISGIRCTMNGRSKEKISDFLTYKCDCITNCGFIYVYIVGYVPHEDVRFRSNQTTRMYNFIARAPTISYIRLVKSEILDFIVSIGGAITLFIGCSFLSISQLIYYFLIKPVGEYFTQKNAC